MDVFSLSDGDLKTMLTERGVDVGPILGSTRRVYQKKLDRMIATENGMEGSMPEEPEQEEFEEEFEDDGVDYANADTQPVDFIPVTEQPTYYRQQPEPTYRKEPEATYSQPDRHSPRRPPRAEYERADDVVGSSRITGDDITLTRRTLRTTTTTSSSRQTSDQPASQQKTEAKKGGGRSICLQLLIFVIVAVLIFLVIQNMEPAIEDPVKGLHSGDDLV